MDRPHADAARVGIMTLLAAAVLLAICAPLAVQVARAGEVGFGVRLDSLASVSAGAEASKPLSAVRGARLTDRPRTVPRTGASESGAADLDARFLLYRQMLTQVAADKDSVSRSADNSERAALFAHVSDLSQLERELDQMERLLDAQRARLGVLQRDFAGRQRTELDVLVTGGALEGRVDSVVVTLEDGLRVASALNGTQRESLKHGGTLEVFRGLVEPREQVIDVAFLGEGWSAVGHGFITLEPVRDRLTFLKLDLAQAQPAHGITSVLADSWLLEPELPTAEATRNRP